MPFAVRRPQRNLQQMAHLPAPLGGLNTTGAGVSTPPTDALVLWNMVAAEYGLRSRLGWREWVTGMDGTVRSILPYTGSSKSGGLNKLFACTSTGIWDVTSSTSSPSRVVTFTTQNSDSGWGICTAFTTVAGHFLCYTDEANGYFLYTEGTNTWVQVTAGAGANQIGLLSGNTSGLTPDPTKFVFCMSWQNMLWFVERDSGTAWYLPAGQVTGSGAAGAAPFIFGNKFKAGGCLVGLWSWTYDGGSGPNDRLVALSSGGDLLIYAGTNPASASTFSIVGAWHVGALPAGRRVASDFGGDILILSALGLIPLTKLVVGTTPVYDRTQYLTYKVGNLFANAVQAAANVRGWAPRIHPVDNTLIVIVPTVDGSPSTQMAMSMLTKGWSQYRDMPWGQCAETWNGSLYFGTSDGRVCVNDGYVDGVTLAAPGNTYPIQFSLITAYQNLGRPTQKKIELIRPKFLSQSAQPAYTVEARYLWDLSEILTAPVSAGASTGAATWDVSKWDQALWAGQYQANQATFGAIGCGYEAAIALRGSASGRMVLTGMDIVYQEGGVL